MRHYKSYLGTRQYANYTPHILHEALDKISLGQLTQRQASKKYNIPRGTLQNKLKNRGKENSKPGYPTALSSAEEESLVQHILVTSAYGFPLTSFDSRCVVKPYLDRCGKTVKSFKNNMPGTDWAISFIRRHKRLTVRMAANIKTLRAKVSPAVISSVIDNLEATVEGVPRSNIWNYDETNLTDDPGSKKAITKRGCKYPERMLNSSKSSTSIMICGNAEGILMPPYFVYKSECMWRSWVEGGPAGARFNRTKFGWFYSQCFEDWFLSIALPCLKNQDGRKVLIGDNLSSYISSNVLQLCEKHDIAFVALPPNSTHLTQPLDVAFFRPMKSAWRTILSDFKLKRGGDDTVLKDVFPRLLKKLMNIPQEKGASIVSEFRKCGFCPISKSAIVSRMPKNVLLEIPEDETTDVNTSVSDSVHEFLSTARYGDKDGLEKKRRKKLDVPPGKSIGVKDLVQVPVLAPNNSTKQKTNDNLDPIEDEIDVHSHDSDIDSLSLSEASLYDEEVEEV